MTGNTELLKQAEEALDSGDIQKASQLCKEILLNDKEDASGYNLVGKLLRAVNNPTMALDNFLEAVKFSPNSAEYHVDAGRCYLVLNQNRNALNHLNEAISLDPQNAHAQYYLARHYFQTQEIDKTVAPLKQAIKLNPQFSEAYELLATSYEMLHKLDLAEKIILKSQELSPNNSRITLPCAKLYFRKKEYDKSITELNKIISSPASHSKWVVGTAYNIMGKICEQQSRYDDSFANHSKGQELLKQSNIELNAGTNLEFNTMIESYKRWFTPQQVLNWSVDDNAGKRSPVFLVGFPRSGTTLAEQILSTHKNIITTQEAPLINHTIEQLPNLFNQTVTYPDILNDLNPQQVEALQKSYFDEAQRLFKEDISGKVIVDKMPLNIMHIGTIYRIFPNAKILTMLRDPRDACLSCFFQIFNHNMAMSEMYTLESTVKAYKQSLELYKQYKKIMKLNLLEVRYEDLVDNLEDISRSMLEFVDVNWDDNVLHYYKESKERVVTTPSYESVTKPIYKSSVGKWKNYEKHFSSLLPTLLPFIKEFGYET